MPRQETMKFPTRSPGSFASLLSGVRSLPSVTIDGILMLPDNLPAKAPLVVTSIGSRGLTSGRETLYAEALTQAGIAMLIVDSYTGRGFTETVSDQGRLSFASSAADALFALDHIRSDNRFDPDRIALLGYSRGGSVSVMCYDARVQQAVLGGKASFSAHVALYPPCYMQWENPKPTSAPMLMLFGGKDVQAPADVGEAYGKRLTAAGGRVEVITFPELVHSFDASEPMKSQGGHNLGAAEIMVGDDGSMIERKSGIRASEDWSTFLRDVRKAVGREGRFTGWGPLPRDIAVAPIMTFLKSAFQM